MTIPPGHPTKQSPYFDQTPQRGKKKKKRKKIERGTMKMKHKLSDIGMY